MNINTDQLVDQVADAGLTIPEHTLASLLRYLFDGLHPGGFVEAVLCNDLLQATQTVDYMNMDYLVYIAEFTLWYMPSSARGNSERLQEWCSADSNNRMLFRTKMAEELICGTPILEAMYNYASSHSYC